MRSQLLLHPWDVALVAAFVVGGVIVVFPSLIYPELIGSHAVLYTAAAAAMLNGSDPWSVGPPIFAGPPTMPLTFVPFAFLPDLLIRASWITIDVLVAVWAIRRLKLPLYWILFPPLLQTILLGHPEVLVLALIVGARTLSGLAIVVKPYAVFPLLAERRWRAIALAVAAVLVTAPVLPWPRFFAELPEIIVTIIRQNNGDSTIGDPLAMTIGAFALALLGPRRALWLVVPVLWPYAQPNYKVMTMPALAPVLAFAWAIPLPGLTLAGLVALATLVMIDRRRPLPAWLRAGIREPAGFSDIAERSAGRSAHPHAALASAA